MNFKIRIMCMAVKHRLAAGESFQAILDSYPRLTENEKAEIRKAVNNG